MKEEIRNEIERLWEEVQKKFEEKNKKIKPEDTPKARKKHCEKVHEIVTQITNVMCSDDYLKTELEIAALLHDIKKYKKDHAESGAKYIGKHLQIEGVNVDNICEIVRYHSIPNTYKWHKINGKICDNKIRKAICIIRVSDELSKDKKEDKKIDNIVSEVYRNLNANIISEKEKEEIKEIVII